MINFQIYFLIFSFFFCFCQNDKYSFLKKEFPQFNQFKKIKIYNLKIVKKISTQKENFCQGIFYDKKFLYYSSGLYGKSVLKKINLKNNKIVNIYRHPENIFAEGITSVNNFIWQLSWKKEKVFIFDKSLKLLKNFNYDGEGWGLTHDNDYLIMSDGSHFLYYRDKRHFYLIEKKKVYYQNKERKISISRINALQRVGDNIFANIWYKKIILMINKYTGRINGAINCHKLFLEEKKTENDRDVLNGIAHKEKNFFYFTGKNWQNIYLVELY